MKHFESDNVDHVNVCRNVRVLAFLANFMNVFLLE